jgi:hypothetical protein
MKRIAPAAPNASSLNPLAGLVCTGVAVVIALLCGAPEGMVQGWGVGLLLALRVDAPAVWRLVLNSPDLWHVGVFAVLTVVLLIAAPSRPRLCVHTALLLGVFLELVQIFVPGREAGLGDFIYNLAGVSLAFFAYVGLKRLRGHYRK